MKTMKIGIILLALLLVTMAMVPVVSAEDVGTNEYLLITSLSDYDTDKSQWEGVGGMEITKTGKMLVKSLSALGTRSTYTWTAGTDIWNPIISVKSIHYSYSRMDNAPYDIDKIGVRGRVWKNNILQFDESSESPDGADASVNFQSSGPIVGSWFARSNHVFENDATSDYWYPVTEDYVNC
ncbi:MAG: hypothetical protein WC164_04575 [Patescibacteria group bacterium]